MERPRRKRGPGRGAGVEVRVRAKLPQGAVHSASPVPSSAPSGHLLPVGEGWPKCAVDVVRAASHHGAVVTFVSRHFGPLIKPT
ncbi:hypothetical protein C1H21_01160 [Xanthomonas arboricola pv. juglandis]|nr:hypothetical protein C1H21_01160 [Xanthomonas arboricola pv. juglandis]